MSPRLAVISSLWLVACSSSSEGSPTTIDDAATTLDGGESDASISLHDANASDSAVTTDGSASRDASTATDTKSPVDASPACASFCKCMSENCAAKKFVVDCLTDCATQTNWDLPCRANMCSLVPAQPDNDHCTHAMGVDQCLAL